MAKVTITKEQTGCDYPGCECRVTDLGGKMTLCPVEGPVMALGDSDDRTIDLCRQHRRSLEAWWNRGKDGDA